MKPIINVKKNFQTLENLIRTMSKGYYADFSEYHPDHTDPDNDNDYTLERENDHTEDPETNPGEPLNQKK